MKSQIIKYDIKTGQFITIDKTDVLPNENIDTVSLLNGYKKIEISITPPTDPEINDLWIDINP